MSEFDTATAVSPDGPGRWRTTVHDGWDVAGVPNGGYLLAIVAGALIAAVDRPDPVALTAHYVAPAQPGEAEVRTEVLRQGRRLATARAELRQGDRAIAHVLATLGDLTDGAGAPTLPWKLPDLPPPERCVAVGDAPVSFKPEVLGRLDERIHPDHVGFGMGRPHGTAEIAGWVRLGDDRPVDSKAIVFMADAFPPPIFNAAFTMAWVPTMELTVHLHKRPAVGWIGARFHTDHVAGGYLEEDGVLFDEEGDLVAVSRQMALLPRED